MFCASASADANDTYTKVDDGQCDEKDRYESEEECEGEESCSGTWFAGPWGLCLSDGEEAPCDVVGRKARKVFCIDVASGEAAGDPAQCQADLKPFEDDSCREACPKEEEKEEDEGEADGESEGEGEGEPESEDGAAEGEAEAEAETEAEGEGGEGEKEKDEPEEGIA